MFVFVFAIQLYYLMDELQLVYDQKGAGNVISKGLEGLESSLQRSPTPSSLICLFRRLVNATSWH